MRLLSNLPRFAALGLACGLSALAAIPSAKAYWVAPPVVVAPAPVVVAPPPPVVVVPRARVAYAPYPGARWVPPHYNRWGRFIPGHWF